jgi:hypothetical protein
VDHGYARPAGRWVLLLPLVRDEAGMTDENVKRKT